MADGEGGASAGGAPPAEDGPSPAAPWGYRKDGQPRKKLGRPRKGEEKPPPVLRMVPDRIAPDTRIEPPMGQTKKYYAVPRRGEEVYGGMTRVQFVIEDRVRAMILKVARSQGMTQSKWLRLLVLGALQKRMGELVPDRVKDIGVRPKPVEPPPPAEELGVDDLDGQL